jgi:hypothetical protein
MSLYIYNTRTDRVEGASFGVVFFSSQQDGTVSCSYESSSTYRSAGKPVFSAEQIQRSVAIFDSRPITMSSNVVSWKNLIWSSYVPTGCQVYFYVRSSSSNEGLKSETWQGPLLNKTGEDISSQTGRILQFRIALYSAYDEELAVMNTPEIGSVLASCYVQGLSQTFYTSKLSLGFVPKQVIITYNGSIPTGTIINFAVSTIDSVDSKDYKIISPNTVVEVEEIAKNQFLKVSISALGNTEVPFVVDEFAVAIGGEGFSLIKSITND